MINKSALFFKRGYGIIIIIIIIIIGLLEDLCGSGFLLNKWECKIKKKSHCDAWTNCLKSN
jgi:uncharacterized SAM-binding protein YcdF (DUF218 family)